MSGINVSLAPNNYHKYFEDTSSNTIKADIKTFEIEAETLTQANQDTIRKDQEWKREAEMVVATDNLLAGLTSMMGLFPDGITTEDVQGETPIKKKMFGLLDRDYQLRVDIETRDLMIRKCQLGLLKNALAYKTNASTSVPRNNFESITTKLLSHMGSAVFAKEYLLSKLSTVQQQRGLVEAQLLAHREAHSPDVKMDGTEIKDKLNKLDKDRKAGKATPQASAAQAMGLFEIMVMHKEAAGELAFDKGSGGRTIAEICREEGKSFGEVLKGLAEAERAEKKKTGGRKKKGKARKMDDKEVVRGSM